MTFEPVSEEQAKHSGGVLGNRGTGRRRVLDYLLATGVGATVVAIVYPVIRFMIPPRTIEATQNSVVAGKVGELKPNSGKIFKFGTKPGLLVLTESGEFRAFSAICTHLDCIVQFLPEEKHIWCACHNGHYDLKGRNISGPPPRPLEEYVVNIRGDDVVISRA